jgi:hypothetical protein
MATQAPVTLDLADLARLTIVAMAPDKINDEDRARAKDLKDKLRLPPRKSVDPR